MQMYESLPPRLTQTHTRTKLLCEVDTSGQVWREMPGIVSPLHNCRCLARWNPISRLFWGCNGPTKAPNAFPEKRPLSRHQSVCPCTPLSPVWISGRCLLSLALPDWGPLLCTLTSYPLTTRLHNTGMWKRGWVSVCVCPLRRSLNIKCCDVSMWGRVTHSASLLAA